MIGLANRVGVTVECDMNGVKVLAKPGVSSLRLYEAFKAELNSKAKHKMVSV